MTQSSVNSRSPRRVILVEDDVMFRKVFRKVCEQELKYVVGGEAGTGRRAKQVISLKRPDLVILDLNLPEGDGFEVYDSFRFRWPEIRVVMISAHCDNYTLYRVEKSGAPAFIDKNTQAVETLQAAATAVFAGDTYFSKSFHAARRQRDHDAHDFTKILSERELEVLGLIGESLSDQEIEQRLGIAKSTAQKHRTNIMTKLGADNSSKLMRYALEQGLVRVTNKLNRKPTLTSQYQAPLR